MAGRRSRVTRALLGAPCFVALVSSLLVTSARAAEPILFWPSRLVFDWDGPIAIGDLNGDGLTDVASVGGGGVGVSLGVGDGTFGPRSWYPAAGVGSIALGDLDGDDALDVVAGGETVYVFLGLGDGSLAPGVTCDATGTVELGDFDADDVPDIACGEPGGVAVLLGEGDGTFAPPAVQPVPGFVEWIATADLNGDQVLDLVLAGGDLVVMLGLGDGTFGAPATAMADYYFRDLVVADANGDLVPDIACADNNDVYVLLGLGDGGFASPTVAWNCWYSGAIDGLGVGDLNGDPIPDLAVTVWGSYGCQNGNVVQVLAGQGDGSFIEGEAASTGDSPNGVAVSDLNGDLISDLVIGNGSVLLGLGGGHFAFEETRTFCWDRAPSFVTVGDLFGDPASEIAATHGECYSIAIFGEGESITIPIEYRTPRSLVIADFNGDEVGDLAAVEYGGWPWTSEIAVYPGGGDWEFTARIPSKAGTDPTAMVAGDVNGDGVSDLGVTDPASNQVAVLLGEGDGSFAPALFHAMSGSPTSLGLSDLNGDQRADLVVTTVENLSVFLSNGDGTFETAGTHDAGGRCVQLADLDANGIRDVVVGGDSLAVLLGLGGGDFQPPTFYPGVAGSVAISDVNGDGTPDLATVRGYSLYEGSVAIFIGRGDGTFVRSNIAYGAGDWPRCLAAGDVNGDGTNDLAVASQRSYNSFIAILPGRFVSPNAVELAAFTADSAPEGILVSWATALETDHAGFRLHRSATIDGARARIGPDLILPTDPYRYLDAGVSAGAETFYWLEALDLHGGSQWFGPATARWVAAPHTTRLRGSAPNPFRPGEAPVRIGFDVARETEATLRVYDVAGRLVRVLFDDRVSAETHEVLWNGRDERGGPAGSGVYYYRLDAGDYSATRSLLLLR